MWQFSCLSCTSAKLVFFLNKIFLLFSSEGHLALLPPSPPWQYPVCMPASNGAFSSTAYMFSFSARQFLHKSHALSLLRLAAVTSSRPSPSLPSSLQKAHPKIHVQFPSLDQCLYYLTYTNWALRSPFPPPSTSCPMLGPSNFLLFKSIPT